MASDLGVQGAEVHAKASDVLGFWFDMLMPEQWFAKSDTLDAQIADRFGLLRDAVLASGAAEWREDPETLLAAVILLDQFGRNIHRGSGEAFAADALAQELTALAIEREWDQNMSRERRLFLYMPLQHAESRELQAASVQLFEALGVDEPLAFAREHAEVIARFGRFPTRNAALGRQSTPEEETYLRETTQRW